MVKQRHGSLNHFLEEYPHVFALSNDPPFNHIALVNGGAAAQALSPSSTGAGDRVVPR